MNNSVLEKENCEKGYKKCGKLDDMGNYICVKENDECPINDIKVTDLRDEELERLNYSHIIINYKYFYYTNTSEKPVISKLKVAEEGKICADTARYYTKYPQYNLVIIYKMGLFWYIYIDEKEGLYENQKNLIIKFNNQFLFNRMF